MAKLKISGRLAARFITAQSRDQLEGFAAYPGALACLEPAAGGSNMDLVNEWYQDAADTQYAYSDSSAFNSGYSATTGQLAVEYWFRPGRRTGDPVHAICSRGTGNSPLSATQFAIGGLDTQYGSNTVNFGMYNTVSAAWIQGRHRLIYTDDSSTNKSIATANIPLWSHALWLYDGAGATDADRLRLYVDGVQVTLEFIGTGGVPVSMVNQAGGQFRVGQSRVAVYTGTPFIHYLRGSPSNSDRAFLGPLRIWTTGVSALAAEAASLFNGGRPKLYAELSASQQSGCIASYEWGDNTSDSSGNATHLSPSGTQKYSQAVLGVRDLVDHEWWRPRWGGGVPATNVKWPQYAVNGGANTTADPAHITVNGLAYALAPTLDLSTGEPWLECRGAQHLERPVPSAWFGHRSYEWWHSVRLDNMPAATSGAEAFGLNFTSDSDDFRDNYHLLFMAPKTAQNYRYSTRSRVQDDVNQEQDGTEPHTITTNGEPHIARMLDDGTAALLSVRSDGIDRALVKLPGPGAAENSFGLSNYTAGQLPKLSIHATKFANANSGIGIARYGVQWIGGPRLSDADSRRIELNLAAKYQRVGHGRHTTGGQAGDVYTVSVLTGGSETPGTLAYGIENAPAEGRTILFSVNGTTDNQTITTSKSNITIDGSSAPGGGFCFMGRMTIQGSNWIIKNIRVRPGRQADPSINTHPIRFLSPGHNTNTPIENFLLKNVSVSWGNDEHVSFSCCRNVTVQNCLIGEPIFDAFPPVYTNQSKSCLAFYRCERVTAYQNVLIGGIRTPLASGRDIEIVNNVSFGAAVTPGTVVSQDTDTEPKYYPTPKDITIRDNLALYSAITQVGGVAAFMQTYSVQFHDTPEVFLSGNKIDASWSDGVLTLVNETPSGSSGYVALAEEPATGSGVTGKSLAVDSAGTMLSTVLAAAGAKGVRDAVDTRLVALITDRASAVTTEHSAGYSTYLIADEDDVGGFPAL